MAIQFEEIPAGETRQINGPVFGVRVLDVGEGAALEVDRVTIPVGVLVTLEHEIDRVRATGPILFARGESIDDDVTKASATPPKPAGGPFLETAERYGLAVGFNLTPWEVWLERPSWARSLVAYLTSPVGSMPTVEIAAAFADGSLFLLKAAATVTVPAGGALRLLSLGFGAGNTPTAYVYDASPLPPRLRLYFSNSNIPPGEDFRVRARWCA